MFNMSTTYPWLAASETIFPFGKEGEDVAKFLHETKFLNKNILDVLLQCPPECASVVVKDSSSLAETVSFLLCLRQCC